jgi:hypothetical protein
MTFTISNLTENEVNIILGGLAELPAKISIELIAKVKAECEEQLKEQKESEE